MEETSIPTSTDTPFPTVSSGDSGTTSSDNVSSGDAAGTGTDSPYVVYTGSPEYETEALALLQDVQATQALVLASNQRLELQFEACISVLLIFLVVGLLNYIYKFFKMFF